jgi:hypothetical protein
MGRGTWHVNSVDELPPGIRDRVRQTFVGEAAAMGAAAAATGGRGRSRNIRLTEAAPEPVVEVEVEDVWPKVRERIRAWHTRHHLFSSVLRVVPTEVAIVPFGGRSGRWRYLAKGYVRTWIAVFDWTAVIDATTGRVLEIGEDEARSLG